MPTVGSHIVRMHGMTAREYRIKHGLPASHSLASESYRARQRENTLRRLAEGSLRPDPIAASEAARHAGRGQRTAEDLARQAEIARSILRQMIPDGGKRADGRDAVRAREAQRRRRAKQRDNEAREL
ncbi:MucR family transcriptional regulator [Pseudogemmobacter sonorensis]|uniref:MucR family transcriptional regulator n=1 Tax=Pseudogemmobacter sonorensis TaxID=2989681 RepID=UPI003F6631E9